MRKLSIRPHSEVSIFNAALRWPRLKKDDLFYNPHYVEATPWLCTFYFLRTGAEESCYVPGDRMPVQVRKI